jgi:hypothetical protein
MAGLQKVKLVAEGILALGPPDALDPAVSAQFLSPDLEQDESPTRFDTAYDAVLGCVRTSWKGSVSV